MKILFSWMKNFEDFAPNIFGDDFLAPNVFMGNWAVFNNNKGPLFYTKFMVTNGLCVYVPLSNHSFIHSQLFSFGASIDSNVGEFGPIILAIVGNCCWALLPLKSNSNHPYLQYTQSYRYTLISWKSIDTKIIFNRFPIVLWKFHLSDDNLASSIQSSYYKKCVSIVLMQRCHQCAVSECFFKLFLELLRFGMVYSR